MHYFSLFLPVFLTISTQLAFCQSLPAEKTNAASPIFTIEVPGPSVKDPEKEATKFFKDKLKEQLSEHPQEKVVTMRLSGSLCPACLKALAHKFQNTPGVMGATIELPSKVKQEPVEGDSTTGKIPRYAQAKISYDANVLSVERIKEIVRQNDLAYWNVVVK